jgi:hypothetical protein
MTTLALWLALVASRLFPPPPPPTAAVPKNETAVEVSSDPRPKPTAKK